MHNPFDQLAKNILRDSLSLASETESEVEVAPAAQKIDIYCVPLPGKEAERKQLGELGRLSQEASLFEAFHKTPDSDRVLSCLRKQLVWHHELQRRAKSERKSKAKSNDGPDQDQCESQEANHSTSKVSLPALVVISSGRPTTVLETMGFKEAREGIYASPVGFKMFIVVLSELKKVRETLPLRLLGSGKVLKEALAELSILPHDAWEKSMEEPHLLGACKEKNVPISRRTSVPDRGENRR